MAKTKEKRTINIEKIPTYTKFIELPFKLNACWEWYPKTTKESLILLNNIYLAMVQFVLVNLVVAIFLNFYFDWTETSKPSLEDIAECVPFIASVAVVHLCSSNRAEMYELSDYINRNFKFHSARGLTNITMMKGYKIASYFRMVYLTFDVFSCISYAVVPFIIHFVTGEEEPLQGWFYVEVTETRFLLLAFLRQVLAHFFMAIALGHLSNYFAMHAILLCGQYELLCCCIRNARFTAILKHGVRHDALVKEFSHVEEDERNDYFFNECEMVDSIYHYDEKVSLASMNRTSHFDIYDKVYDDATEEALRECVKMHQMISDYVDKLNDFISPLLVARIMQVTLYLCTLYYGISREFKMIAVEYVMLVGGDIGIYCYFGNQITLQASQVTIAAFQSFWQTMGVAPRRTLLNLILATKRPVIVKCLGLLPMDLETYITLLKTSFSFYTLLTSVNEETE